MTTTQIDKLRAERTSTSNKISGVNTQIKRNEARHRAAEKAGDTKRAKKAQTKLGQLERRLEALHKDRDKLNVKIRELAGPRPLAGVAAKAHATATSRRKTGSARKTKTTGARKRKTAGTRKRKVGDKSTRAVAELMRF
jgi:predicted  nucleic acid-binding Zn-ribbon protein